MAIKESCVRNALNTLSGIFHLIQKHMADETSSEAHTLRHWAESFDELKKKSNDFEILVGVAGETGAGKTSLLNALLGTPEMLPSGQDQAATAVACKVSWNPDPKPGQENCAMIHLRSTEEVVKELMDTMAAFNVQREIHAGVWEYDTKDQRDEDLAHALTEIKEGMDKISAVWLHLSEEEFEEMALECEDDDDRSKCARKILNSNCDVFDLLESGTKVIYDSDARRLAEQVKPYLDCTKASHGVDKHFSAWPLIQHVNILGRSPILQFASLVDLPGLGDNVDSRCKVAQEYKSKLDLRLVVADVNRAADNRIALNLMGEYEKCCMQMDGRYSETGLGVVLTKMERIRPERYLAKCEDIFVKNNRVAVDKATIALKSLKGRRKDLEGNIRRNNKRISSAKKKEKKRPKPKQKHKGSLNSDCQKVKSEIKTARSSIKRDKDLLKNVSLDEAKQEIARETAQGHLLHTAISNRNAYVRERMQTESQKRLQRTARQGAPGKGKLEKEFDRFEVLPTSAEMFMDLQGGGKPALGFPTQKYTGIPYLEQWIYKATSERRGEHFDAILAGIETIVSGLHQWSRQARMEQCLDLDRKSIEEALEDKQEGFDGKLQDLFKRIYPRMVELNPMQQRGQASARFRSQAADIVRRWVLKFPDDGLSAEKMHAMTYHAIIRRYGGPYTGGSKIQYNWIRPLVLPILKFLIVKWRASFKTGMEDLWESVQGELEELWREYLDRIDGVASEFGPELLANFAHIRVGLKAVQSELRVNGLQRMKDFFNKAGDARKIIIRVMVDAMTPAFKEAQEIRGVGRFMAQRDVFDSFIEGEAEVVFDHVWRSLEKDINGKKLETHQELLSVGKKAVRSSKMQTETLLENLLGGADSVGDMTTLRGRTQKALLELRAQWEKPEGYEGHILLQYRAIPPMLRAVDLDAAAEQRDGSEPGTEDGSDVDSGDDSDDDWDEDMKDFI